MCDAGGRDASGLLKHLPPNGVRIWAGSVPAPRSEGSSLSPKSCVVHPACPILYPALCNLQPVSRSRIPLSPRSDLFANLWRVGSWCSMMYIGKFVCALSQTIANNPDIEKNSAAPCLKLNIATLVHRFQSESDLRLTPLKEIPSCDQ